MRRNPFIAWIPQGVWFWPQKFNWDHRKVPLDLNAERQIESWSMLSFSNIFAKISEKTWFSRTFWNYEADRLLTDRLWNLRFWTNFGSQNHTLASMKRKYISQKGGHENEKSWWTIHQIDQKSMIFEHFRDSTKMIGSKFWRLLSFVDVLTKRNRFLLVSGYGNVLSIKSK